MSNLLGPRDANGIPVPMTVDESIASMKASLLKKIKRSAYVYRVDCGGCNGCEIEIFATLSPLFDAERFGIKVVPSPRHADILLFTGAVTRAMRSPALRAWQSAPDPKICISYGACGNSGGINHDRICLDPGPGFGKTAKQTIELMRNFQELVHLGYPTMVAVSRKSYIGYAYGIDEPKERDSASAAEALMACELGASVIRTHNVALTEESLKENLRPYAFIGLGCNVALVADEGEELEGKKAMLSQAITDMCLLPDSQIIDVSSFYESEPAYVEDQDSFVNAVLILRTGLPPQELLRYLNIIEDRLGRIREKKNGPRTCDLDILDYQGYVSDLDVLTLPHPLLTERDFVVKPLLEIAPNHELSDGTKVTLETVKVGKAWKC